MMDALIDIADFGVALVIASALLVDFVGREIIAWRVKRWVQRSR